MTISATENLIDWWIVDVISNISILELMLAFYCVMDLLYFFSNLRYIGNPKLWHSYAIISKIIFNFCVICMWVRGQWIEVLSLTRLIVANVPLKLASLKGVSQRRQDFHSKKNWVINEYGIYIDVKCCLRLFNALLTFLFSKKVNQYFKNNFWYMKRMK